MDREGDRKDWVACERRKVSAASAPAKAEDQFVPSSSVISVVPLVAAGAALPTLVASAHPRGVAAVRQRTPRSRSMRPASVVRLPLRRLPNAASLRCVEVRCLTDPVHEDRCRFVADR